MRDVTIESLAKEIQISVNRLVQQFADAGINKTIVDTVTQQEKEILLAYLNRNRSNASNKLTLQRKTRSTLNIPSIGGKSRSVQIEIRKNRTYLKQEPTKVQEHTNNKEHIQHKTKFETIKQTKYVISKNDKSINQQINGINKSSHMNKKNRREAEVIALKRKVEKEMLLKAEEKARQAIEEACRMAEEQQDNWNKTVEALEIESTDYHVMTSYYAREAEDENDRKIEGDRRSRARTSKINKQKKTSRLSESKADREEARSVGKSKNKRKPSTLMQRFNKPVQIVNRDVTIGETITVSELANKMAVKGSQVIKTIIKLGSMATINQIIDQETAQLIAEEMGHKVILHLENELEESIISDRNIHNNCIAEFRAPLVTIMGHVDHGKTSLLDYIRSTKVAKEEAGGITQHIGAYHVKTANGMITFIDTPGHAAFTAMRARGAQATDIIVLVVAADDGVMPQTIEAIQHAKAANVPIVVAINKIDKPEADPDKINNDLTKYGIISEEWGGENQFIYISAKTGEGIDKLLNAILLQAEILELKTTSNGMANGIVIESYLDRGRGPIATIIVRNGTLNRGDVVLCGFEYGRIRAMRNETGQDIISAGPLIPVEIIGLSGVPIAGDEVTVVRDEKKAREVALYRQGKFRAIKLARQQKTKSKNIFANMNSTDKSELKIVLKSDVQGSIEAINNALNNLSTNDIKIKIISSGVGGITETDALLAVASNAIILGFNVRANTSARRIIKKENLDIHYYSVIYDLIDAVKKIMSGILTPEYKQEITGLAEVRNIFRSPKFSVIAGCMVTEGVVKRRNKIRILRENIIIYEGEIESLRRFKDDANEVRNGMECGIGIKNYNDICSGDIIEVFETVKIPRIIN